ncbi:transposable element Tcb1 transposase [Trichonephila clavipes]|nr:transposable element Tcb1 transposase [Trichonephila clavipes]
MTRIVQRFFVSHQIELLPWTARSPYLSPIENMWSMVALRLNQFTHQINFGNVWKLLGLLYPKNTSKVSLNQCRGVWQCERTVRHWFRKFILGDLSLCGKAQTGRPRVLDDEALQAAIEEDSSQTCGELGRQFNTSSETVRLHLHRLDYHLFHSVDNHLRGKSFTNEADEHQALTDFFASLTTSLTAKGLNNWRHVGRRCWRPMVITSRTNNRLRCLYAMFIWVIKNGKNFFCLPCTSKIYLNLSG